MKTIGPFTPQELDRIAGKLSSQQISFRILKDEEAERLAMRDDFANVVKKADLRLENYLGQVFYLELEDSVFDQHLGYFRELGFATAPERTELATDIESSVHIESAQKKKWQRILVFLYVGLAIVFLVWSFLD